MTDTVLKVSVPVEIEWVCIAFYFDVADNCGLTGFHQRHHLAGPDPAWVEMNYDFAEFAIIDLSLVATAES